jgi:hypothetical protein
MMSRIYLAVAFFTASMLTIYIVKYLDGRAVVEISCGDPKIGKFSGPSRVVKTPLGWVVTRKVEGHDKVEVYETCSRYWP